MAQESPRNGGTVRTFLADGAITKTIAVKLSTGANTVATVSAASDTVIGIPLDTVADGEEIDVLIVNTGGTVKMTSAGSISKGDYVGLSGTAGKIGSLTLDGSGTTIQQVLGIALSDADADDVIEVTNTGFIYQV